jgi:ATP synthase protein I
MQQAGKRLRVIKLLLIWQFMAALGAGALALLVGPVAAWSALLGGLICWLPNCYFAFRAFRHKGARAAKKIVRSFYVGEAGKMAITVLLFAVVFTNVRPLHALALFAGYLAVQTLNWFVPLWVSHSETRQISQ